MYISIYVSYFFFFFLYALFINLLILYNFVSGENNVFILFRQSAFRKTFMYDYLSLSLDIKT